MKAFRKIRDSLIIERIKNGDSEAFAEVYDEYNQKIYRYLFFKVPNTEVAEDLTGQVFLKFWEYVRQADKKIDNLQAFLYHIAHNLLIDYYRTRKDNLSLDNISGQIATAAEKKVEFIHQGKNMDRLIKALAELSDDYNDLITLRFIEDYSVREIAALLGKTENNVRVTLHRAIKALKEILDE